MEEVTRQADVVMLKFGSHLYGLATSTSDVDWKGVFLNTLDELLIGEGPHTISYSTGPKDAKNGADDTDFEIMSLHKFVKHAIQGETFAIDMLHCNDPEVTSDAWEFLVANRTKFYSKHMKSYVGYVKSQAGKYGVKGNRLTDITSAIKSIKDAMAKKLGVDSVDAGCWADFILADLKDDLHYGEFAEWKEKENARSGGVDEYYMVNAKMYQSTNTAEYVLERLNKMYDSYGHRAKLAEANEGIDWKAVSHALRAGYQALYIYKDGDYEYPLPETDFLKAVKAGELDYNTEVGPALDKVVDDVEKYSETCALPESVDAKFWKDWLLQFYKDRFDLV